MCDAIGIDHPDWLQGKSILPLVRGEADEIHEEIFAEINYHSYCDPQRAVRTKKWKYIRHWYPTARPGDINCDGSPSKSYFLERGWRRKTQPREQLYDLIFDPFETHNLALDPAHQHARNAMRHRLKTWMETTTTPSYLVGFPRPTAPASTTPRTFGIKSRKTPQSRGWLALSSVKTIALPEKRRQGDCLWVGGVD